MAQTQYPVSQRATYEPAFLTRFLWWLSTAESDLVSGCIIDRNRYAIVGTVVLTTWLFATGCWTYFFSTAVDNPLVYIPLGIFMGFVILCIDRALIKGINKQNKRKLTPLLFRGLLAMTIGLFMAQPAVLYLFNKEINTQVSLDNEVRKRTKQQQLDSLYLQKKNTITAELQRLRGEQQLSQAAVNNALSDFIKEADGTGGSGKVGIEAIAKAKKEAYETLAGAHQQLQAAQKPGIDSLESSLAGIALSIQQEEDRFNAQLEAGFLTRVEALQHLLDANMALKYRYYLIIALLMLIELMPVIVKSMLPSGSYDEKVALREELEKAQAYDNIQQERELKQLYNSLSGNTDKQVLKDFFEQSMHDRKLKMDHLSTKFRENHGETFDQIWEKIKYRFLSKQEN